MGEDSEMSFDCRTSLRYLLDLLNSLAADYLDAVVSASLTIVTGQKTSPRPESESEQPPKPRRGWNPEEKAAAVALAAEIGVPAAARKMEASESMIRRWRLAALAEKNESEKLDEAERLYEEEAAAEMKRLREVEAEVQVEQQKVAGVTKTAEEKAEDEEANEAVGWLNESSSFVPSGIKVPVDHDKLRAAAFEDEWLGLGR